MGLKIVTPPTVTPISVVGIDNLKEHLQVATDVSDDDALITAYLNAAWALAEAHTWRQFLTAEYRYTLLDFTAQRKGLRHRMGSILSPRPALQSIVSVEYLDGDGATVELVEDTDFIVDDENDIAAIWPAIDTSWPSVRRNHPKAVTITYTAGYGDTLADMPDMLLHAVKLQVGSWWMNRESVSEKAMKELPAATKALLEVIEVRDDRLVTDSI